MVKSEKLILGSAPRPPFSSQITHKFCYRLNLFRPLKNSPLMWIDSFGLKDGFLDKLKQFACDFVDTASEYIPDFFKEWVSEKASDALGKRGPIPPSSLPGGVGAIGGAAVEAGTGIAQAGPGLAQNLIMAEKNNRLKLLDPSDPEYDDLLEDRDKTAEKCNDVSRKIDP